MGGGGREGGVNGRGAVKILRENSYTPTAAVHTVQVHPDSAAADSWASPYEEAFVLQPSFPSHDSRLPDVYTVAGHGRMTASSAAPLGQKESRDVVPEAPRRARHRRRLTRERFLPAATLNERYFHAFTGLQSC